MPSILQQSWCTLFAALRRFGWLPLSVFLAHELCSHVFDAYRRWPPIDIPLHFLGGLAIAYFTDGALRLFAARDLIRSPERPVHLLLLFCVTSTVAIFWEFAEWFADQTLGTSCQLSLDDTLLDLFMGLLGGLAYLLPQFPAACRDFFQIAPEDRR